MADNPNKIKVNFPPHLQAGAYANNMLVTHTREEFIMDFSFIMPPFKNMGSIKQLCRQ